jgi:hypothetical protein
VGKSLFFLAVLSYSDIVFSEMGIQISEKANFGFEC